MFANRFTVVVDACSLADVLRRDLLLSLAEAAFFRIRWSERIMNETERAIEKIMDARGIARAGEKAAQARRAMETAIEDGMVHGHEALISPQWELPDLGDAHVIAAAIKTKASVIVTENKRHFPASFLRPLDLEAKTADEFIADTIDLDHGPAIAALSRMRQRFKKPLMSAEELLLNMERRGLMLTVDNLRSSIGSL